ncbi:MAG: TetR/AcrR family transcriptional regulator [Xanthomonadales bacterium]|nr:TetR/AcrR family transcriptional regulator [Xanthomonadales bacterium]
MARRNTRELILSTSLELFNEYGEPNVTTNHIADEVDISPGNLYYHFHSKDDIVIELFKRFLARLQPLIEVPADMALHAEDLWFQLHLSFELKGEYRFIYLNLSELTARVRDLDHAMRALLTRERRAASQILTGLQQAGAMQISEQQKEMLTDTMLLALTYWISFANLFDSSGQRRETAQVRAIARVLLLLVPYLREPEKSQFARLSGQYLDKKKAG